MGFGRDRCFLVEAYSTSCYTTSFLREVRGHLMSESHTEWLLFNDSLALM